MSNYLFQVFPDDRYIDLCLYQFGWEQCTGGQSFGPHVRNHFLLHFVISGSGKLYTMDHQGNRNEYRIFSNHGFLIYPHENTTYVADTEHPWEYTWIEFDGLRAKELMTLAGLSPNKPIYKSGDLTLTKQLKEHLLGLSHKTNATPLEQIGQLYLIMDLLTRSSVNRINRSTGRLTDFYIHEALSFIEQNYQNDISVENIADFCRLNRSYFGKIFRNTIGTSPQDFLINYRMKKAAELLKMTSLPIKEISQAVGYPNQLHFSRAFKKIHQVPPRNWRNSNT